MSVAVVAFVVCNRAAAMAAVNDVVVVANVVVISGRGLCCCFWAVVVRDCCDVVVVVVSVVVVSAVVTVLSYGLCRLVFLKTLCFNNFFAIVECAFEVTVAAAVAGVASLCSCGADTAFSNVVAAVVAAASFVSTIVAGIAVTFVRDVNLVDVLLVVGFIVVFVDITNIFLLKNFNNV